MDAGFARVELQPTASRNLMGCHHAVRLNFASVSNKQQFVFVKVVVAKLVTAFGALRFA